MDKTIQRRALQGTPAFSAAIPPLLQRVYLARGVTGDQQLPRALTALARPGEFAGIDQAVTLLAQAVTEQQRVLIVGDFDADGATSCALAILALRAMGLASVDFLVPNRFEYGYGLTPEIVAVARDYQPDLLITVDNGISSVSGVAAAKAAGMAVLVTDHHLPGAQLPAADAIVNPNQPDCAFPSKALAGVGVIFYVMSALRARLRDQGWFAARDLPEPAMAQWLDLVALGTVADVVPLDRNNRILVHQGLLRLRAGQTRPGILALLDVAGRDPARLTAADLGFAVAPRLNAAGRLDDMSHGIRCLLSDDPAEARALALELDGLNRERRSIEQGMKSEAQAAVRQIHLDSGELPWGLCLYDPLWHPGVVGIVAARIKEQVHRPVIAFADENDRQIKGSARSIPGLHIRDALDAVAASQPDLLHKFGGHAMAAGLSLDRDRLGDFQRAFDQAVRAMLDPEALQPVIWSDGELEPAAFSLDTARALRDGGPWGQQFPEPLFDGEFTLVNQRLVGERHLKLTVQVDGGDLVDAIAFNIDPARWPDPAVERLRLAYRLDINWFRGRENLQLIVEHLEPA